MCVREARGSVKKWKWGKKAREGTGKEWAREGKKCELYLISRQSGNPEWPKFNESCQKGGICLDVQGDVKTPLKFYSRSER